MITKPSKKNTRSINMPHHLESNTAYTLIERIPLSQALSDWFLDEAQELWEGMLVFVDGDREELLVCAEPVTLYSKTEK